LRFIRADSDADSSRNSPPTAPHPPVFFSSKPLPTWYSLQTPCAALPRPCAPPFVT
jgi:hypothetical protein